jgi:hypothetical protein
MEMPSIIPIGVVEESKEIEYPELSIYEIQLSREPCSYIPTKPIAIPKQIKLNIKK